MSRANLRILCLEDIEEDAILIKDQLIREGLTISFDHVSTEKEYKDKLSSEQYDLILSDYNLPGFNGLEALEQQKKICPQVPFICISGVIGEDLAVEIMQLGASDYILKDKLSKLPVAIDHAIKVAKVNQARIDAENRLKESTEKYKNLVENINDVVYEINHDGTITYISPVINEISGYTDSYYVGKPLLEFIHEQDRSVTREKFAKFIIEGRISPLEIRIFTKAGNIVWLRASSKLISVNGIVTGIRGIATDITKRKLSDEAIRKLTRAIEQTPVSVVITNLEGEIEYVNNQTKIQTGYSEDELLGQNPRILSSGEKPGEEYAVLWETLISGKEWRGEFHNRKKNGELYWEAATLTAITDEKGVITHYLAVKEDITERKKLTEDLIEAKEKAEKSDRLKTAFLNNISHEVRTPLNGILGFAEFILQPAISDEEKQHYYKALNESSERLLSTINNYMDISLIVSETMPVKSQPIDLKNLLSNIINKFEGKCKAKNLDCILETPENCNAMLNCDEVLLEKAISQLLDNAVKFTVTGSITAGFSYSDGEFKIFVRDTGSGIDPRVHASVFQIFMQEELSNTRGHEGSGLGLSITRGLVDLMGGTINLDSEKGKGTEVMMTFHSGNGDLVAPSPVSDQKITSYENKSPVVLIVEDDMINSAYMEMIMQKFSFDFLLAFNGLEAVELSQSHPEISIVLMDMKMPVMDGLEATSRIKQIRSTMPVIGVTGFASVGDKERALAAGCDEYLTKPVNTDLLIATMNKLLHK
jgi:PAS domain S-box-containing protein